MTTSSDLIPLRLSPNGAVRDPRDDGWSWLNPYSQTRFEQVELGRSTDEDDNVDVLRNVVRICESIFQHVSALEHSSHASSRGAAPSTTVGMNPSIARASIVQAETLLHGLLGRLQKLQAQRLDTQLSLIEKGGKHRPYRVHIGSASHPLSEWINVDVGGGDLMIDVNWGLPLGDESTSHIYCAHLLEHLRYHDQAPRFLREAHRILQPDGVIRLVVPDVRRLLRAYASEDAEFFVDRSRFYGIGDAFTSAGVATLDYILMFCGAGPQQHLSFNHKFGYDLETLSRLLRLAGFSSVEVSSYQNSRHEQLRVDDVGYNAQARDRKGNYFSLFVEATK